MAKKTTVRDDIDQAIRDKEDNRDVFEKVMDVASGAAAGGLIGGAGGYGLARLGLRMGRGRKLSAAQKRAFNNDAHTFGKMTGAGYGAVGAVAGGITGADHRKPRRK